MKKMSEGIQMVLRILDEENQQGEKELIAELGESIGFGRIMNLAEECWREVLEPMGFAGGEFRTGPCVGMTVECGCDNGCDWCAGSRWLTKHVKKIKDENELS